MKQMSIQYFHVKLSLRFYKVYINEKKIHLLRFIVHLIGVVHVKVLVGLGEGGHDQWHMREGVDGVAMKDCHGTN